ncbi:MAG: hypothetical protein ACQESJ_02305 [Bacteroidota bacterium]
MNSNLKTLISLFFLTLFPLFLLSQKNSHHPFSRYGIGEIEQEGFTQNKAMGGISAGLHVKNKINYQNPASYTSQDTNSFVFDVGLKTQQNQFSTENSKAEKSETAFSHMAIGFPVTSKWKSSIGLVPYSNTGYNIETSVEGNTGTKLYRYEGEGGTRKLYIGNAYQINKNLSIGLNYSYLFGTIQNEANIGWNDSDEYRHNGLLTEKKQSINSHVFNLGIQYDPNIFKNYDLTIGASYDISPAFKGENEETHTNYLDTISTTNSFNEDYPSNLLMGFSLSNEKFLWGADFKYTNWSSLSNYDNISDSYSIHSGFQYIPDKGALKNYLKKINYRFGAYYKNGYYKFNGKNIKDLGITFGLGLPLKNNRTNFNISCKLGRQGTVDNELIEKDYAIINFSITFFDFWFMQQKYR